MVPANSTGVQRSLTGGADGLAVPKPQLGGLVLNSKASYFYLVMVFACLATLLSVNIIRTRAGRAFVAGCDGVEPPPRDTAAPAGVPAPGRPRIQQAKMPAKGRQAWLALVRMAPPESTDQAPDPAAQRHDAKADPHDDQIGSVHGSPSRTVMLLVARVRPPQGRRKAPPLDGRLELHARRAGKFRRRAEREEGEMRLSWRDWIASVFVVAGASFYAMSVAGTDVLGASNHKVAAGVVLVFGLAASITAVVYGVGEGLFRANKAYLAITSILGLAALVAGVIALVKGREEALAVLTGATVLLWVMSTARHAMEPAGGLA